MKSRYLTISAVAMLTACTPVHALTFTEWCAGLNDLLQQAPAKFERLRGAEIPSKLSGLRRFAANGPVTPFKECDINEQSLPEGKQWWSLNCDVESDEQWDEVRIATATYHDEALAKADSLRVNIAKCFGKQAIHKAEKSSISPASTSHSWTWTWTWNNPTPDVVEAKIKLVLFAEVPDVGAVVEFLDNTYQSRVTYIGPTLRTKGLAK